MSRLKSWKELPMGGLILEAGNARTYKTGDWRTERPQLDKAKCISCFFCWAYCPDASVVVDADKGTMEGFDYDHCKGCGICASVCPKQAITMIPER